MQHLRSFKDFFVRADNFAPSGNWLKPASLPGGGTGGKNKGKAPRKNVLSFLFTVFSENADAVTLTVSPLKIPFLDIKNIYREALL